MKKILLFFLFCMSGLTHAAEPAAQQDVQAFVRAVAQDDVDEVRRLLAEGANPNFQDAGGMKLTALMLAADSGNRAIVEELLDADANPSTINAEGKTAYDIALQEGNDEVAELLKSRMLQQVTTKAARKRSIQIRFMKVACYCASKNETQ